MSAINTNTERLRFILKSILTPVLILLLVAAIILSVYISVVDDAAQERTYRLLSEAVKTQSVMMEERTESSFEQLAIIAGGLDWTKSIYSDSNVLRNLQVLAQKSQFENVAIADREGRMRYQNGNVGNCSDRSYFKDAISGYKSVQYVKTGRMSGNSVFVFAAPVYYNMEIVGVITGTKNLNDIIDLLGTYEENKQYNILCGKDGKIIAVPDDLKSQFCTENEVEKCFTPRKSSSSFEINSVKDYEYNGQTYFGVYMPSGLDNVYIFSVVTKNYASTIAGLYSKWAIIAVASIFVFTLIIGFIIIVQLKRRISFVKFNELERQKKYEDYHSLQSKRSIDRLNILCSYHINLSQNTCENKIDLMKDLMPEGTFLSAENFFELFGGHIHENDRERFANIMSTDSLIGAFKFGKTSVQSDFLFYIKNERYVWLRIIADLMQNPVTDDYEAIVYAIGINNEKRLEQIGKKLIGENFEAMGLIDVKSRRVFGIKTLGNKTLLKNNYVLKNGKDYDESMESVLKSFASEAELLHLKDDMSFDNVIKKLETSPFYNVTVHLSSESLKKDSYYRVQFSYVDDYKESVVVSCEDITDILSSKLDTQTGLYNSTGFHEKVTEWIKNNPGKKFRIYRYSLDGFSNVTITYGYEAGNKIIRDVGKYMRASNSDGNFAAHISADDFIRFCAADYPTAEEYYERYTKAFLNYEIPYPLSLRVGVYDLCEEGCDSFVMSHKASLALKSIKDDLSTHIAYYQKGLMEITKYQHDLLMEVDNAVKNNQFEVYFQPQFNHKGEAVGAEALVRWNHPEKGLIGPSEFINLFEQSKQITLLDSYVWEKCCMYIKKWKDEGINLPVSVNVSRIDIRDKKIRQKLSSLVEKYGISPKMLRLEITESAYLTETESLKEAVCTFKKAGFIVEMDDFGSGYSSLNILQDLDIDVLKIDKKLVSKVGIGDEKSDSIFRSVTEMARLLKIAIIAEGVETKEQIDYLKSTGCMVMQGYYFGSPVPYDEFDKFIKSKKQTDK